jgi:O-antigen ligase
MDFEKPNFIGLPRLKMSAFLIAPDKNRGWVHNPGQATIQLILPLLFLLCMLLLLAFFIPSFSTFQLLTLGGGVIFFIVCMVNTQAALYLLILSMLLSPEFVIGETKGASLGRGVTLRLDDLLLIIIGFSWLAKMAIHKKLGLFLKTPLNKPIAFYITICLTSTLFASMFAEVHLATGLFFVLKYFEYTFVYFMVVNHLQNKQQIKNYIWVLFITCTLVSLLGLTQIPSGVRVSAPFEGKIGEPNTFGGYLIFMICLATGFFLATPSLKKQILFGFLIFFFAVPFLYTQSRSSYLAAIPALLSFILFTKERRWFFAILIVIGIMLPYIAPDQAKERVAYTFEQGKNRTDVVETMGVKLDTSTSERLRGWRDVLKDWVQHPFWGFGVSGYRFVDAQYFRVLVETGLIGLLLFLILLSTVFLQAYSSFKAAADPFDRGLCMGFLAGYIALLFHAVGANTFIIVRIMEPFWFVLAMVVMLPHLPEKPVPAKAVLKAESA